MAEPVRLCLPLPFAAATVNAWLLPGEPVTLVDTGCRWLEGRHALEQVLRANGFRVADVEQLVLTHHHEDHAGLAAEIAERSGCLVIAHPRTAAMLADVPASREAEIGYQQGLLGLHGAPAQIVEDARAVAAAAAHFVGSVAIGRFIEEGDVVLAGGLDLTARWSPGHSPCDTQLVSTDGWSLSGDHLFASAPSICLIHRPEGCDDPRERPRALLRYRRELQRTQDAGLRRLLPGHGPPIDDVSGAVASRLAQQDRRAEKLLGLVTEGSSTTAWELLLSVVPGARLDSSGHPISIPYVMLSEILGLLDLLADRGLVAECDQRSAVGWRRV